MGSWDSFCSTAAGISKPAGFFFQPKLEKSSQYCSQRKIKLKSGKWWTCSMLSVMGFHVFKDQPKRSLEISRERERERELVCWHPIVSPSSLSRQFHFLTVTWNGCLQHPQKMGDDAFADKVRTRLRHYNVLHFSSTKPAVMLCRYQTPIAFLFWSWSCSLRYVHQLHPNKRNNTI